MKRLLALLAVGAFVITMDAATLVPTTFPNGDANFTATINTTAGTLNLATPSGPDPLVVFDDLANLVGIVKASDNGVPGQLILAFNSGPTEAILLTFDFTTASFDGSGNLVLNAVGSPVTPITDPALALLQGADVFRFVPTGSQESPFVFAFSSAALPTSVPEPGVALTVGIGLIGLLALRLQKRTN